MRSLGWISGFEMDIEKGIRSGPVRGSAASAVGRRVGWTRMPCCARPLTRRADAQIRMEGEIVASGSAHKTIRTLPVSAD